MIDDLATMEDKIDSSFRRNVSDVVIRIFENFCLHKRECSHFAAFKETYFLLNTTLDIFHFLAIDFLMK